MSRPRSPRARLWRALLAALLAASALTVAPPGLPRAAFATHGAPAKFCVDGVFSLGLFASGTPGETAEFTVTSNPTGTVAYSDTVQGTYADPFTISMTFDASGFGQTATFYMKGLSTGSGQVEAVSEAHGNIDPLPVIIDRVTGIELTTPDDEPLEADPRNPTPGEDLRIFPDASFPGENVTELRKVKATATTELGTQGLTVQFRAWDVDDPSSDPVVDPYGELGGDNFGTEATFGPSSATTDANGEATSTLTVSQQPGDNFRFTASCAIGLQNGLSAIGMDVKKANGDPRPAEVKQSPLITVWRHLHIEADSMGEVIGNELTGTVVRAQNSTFRRRGVPSFPAIKLVLPRVVDDSAGNQVDLTIFDVDEFQDGAVRIGGVEYPVKRSEGSTIWLAAGPDPRPWKGATFRLVDDDKLGNSLFDDGTEVPQPDLSHLKESDNHDDNWLSDLYIRPVHLTAASDTALPFQPNLTEPDHGYCKVLADPCPAGQNSFDHANVHTDRNFWVVYLLGAYQGPLRTDGDPDVDFYAADPGKVTLERADTLGYGAAVFFETIRDEGGVNYGPVCSAAGVAVHGLMHQFMGGGHFDGDDGVMAPKCVDGHDRWSPESERAIRTSPGP